MSGVSDQEGKTFVRACIGKMFCYHKYVSGIQIHLSLVDSTVRHGKKFLLTIH